MATLATLGLYAIWWVRDLMREGNEHFRENWRFEDDLANSRPVLYEDWKNRSLTSRFLELLAFPLKEQM